MTAPDPTSDRYRNIIHEEPKRMPQQHGLGRGLSSLISSKKTVYRRNQDAAIRDRDDDLSPLMSPAFVSGGVREVDIALVVPNPHQPRRLFDETKLEELAQSIRSHGVLQPIIVTKTPSGYELVAGERRLRASKKAGLVKVPVIIRSYEEQQKLELAIVENVQRHDLSPIEEARAYQSLADAFGMNQESIALKMGKSRSSVANTLRLLALPIEVQRALEEGKISEGHAKAILSIGNPEKQRALFDLIIKDHLTVRQAESKAQLESSVRSHTRGPANHNPYKEMEDAMTEALGTRVRIRKQGSGTRVSIDCYSSEDLGKLMKKLK